MRRGPRASVSVVSAWKRVGRTTASPPVGREELGAAAPPGGVDADHRHGLDRHRAAREVAGVEVARRHRAPEEAERVAERRERLQPMRRVAPREQHAGGRQDAVAAVRDAGRMIDDLRVVAHLGDDRRLVPRRDRRIEGRRARRRGVGPHAPGGRRDVRRRRLGAVRHQQRRPLCLQARRPAARPAFPRGRPRGPVARAIRRVGVVESASPRGGWTAAREPIAAQAAAPRERPRARRAMRSTLRSSPASASLSWLSASASGARSSARSARPSSAAACAASMPSPCARSPSYARRSDASAAPAFPSKSSISPAKSSVSNTPCVTPSSSTMRRDDAIIRRAAAERPRSASSTA